jgi:hypothetical protein
MLSWVLQQPPIVVDLVKQPPVAEEITMADVIVGAFGLTGVIMLSAVIAGAIVGAIFIFIKRRRDAAAPPTDPGHSRLRT